VVPNQNGRERVDWEFPNRPSTKQARATASCPNRPRPPSWVS